MSSRGPRCHQRAFDASKRSHRAAKGPLTSLITPPNHHRQTNDSRDLHVILRPISVEAPTNCWLPYISTCCIIF